MSKVEQIEADLHQLSPEELAQIRDFLDNLLEDELPFTAEFEHALRSAEQEKSSGAQPRVRRPEPQ